MDELRRKRDRSSPGRLPVVARDDPGRALGGEALGWNRQPDSTFRIWRASMEGSMAENESPGRFAQVLGEAALDLWSELPQEWQQQLFERAVRLGHKTERDESLREQLAAFLHNHHERTVAR
jgi:hypothetical protein